MGGKSQAPGQDPAEMIELMTQANRIDQYTPDGNIVYSGPNNRVATVSLSPEQQAIKDAQQALTMEATEGMAGNMGGNTPGLGQGMFGGATDEMSALASTIGGLGNLDLGALPGMPAMGDFAGERDQVQGATMDRFMNLINPQFDRREGRENQSLANRGVPEIGGLADVISGRRADDYQQATMGAALESILAGGQEQSRLFNQGMAQRGQGLQEQLANIGNMSKNRQQLFSEIMQSFGAGSSMDNESFNKLAAMLGMAQVNSPGAGMAGFMPAGQADVGGAYNTAQNAWNMNQQNSFANQFMELAGTLGGAGLSTMKPWSFGG